MKIKKNLEVFKFSLIYGHMFLNTAPRHIKNRVRIMFVMLTVASVSQLSKKETTCPQRFKSISHLNILNINDAVQHSAAFLLNDKFLLI